VQVKTWFNWYLPEAIKVVWQIILCATSLLSCTLRYVQAQLPYLAFYLIPLPV